MTSELVLRELKDTSLRFFFFYCQCPHSEKGRGLGLQYNQLCFPPKSTRSAEESATAVAYFSKELCPSVAFEHLLVSQLSLVVVPL